MSRPISCAVSIDVCRISSGHASNYEIDYLPKYLLPFLLSCPAKPLQSVATMECVAHPATKDIPVVLNWQHIGGSGWSQQRSYTLLSKKASLSGSGPTVFSRIRYILVLQDKACADPESFVRGSPILTNSDVYLFLFFS